MFRKKALLVIATVLFVAALGLAWLSSTWWALGVMFAGGLVGFLIEQYIDLPKRKRYQDQGIDPFQKMDRPWLWMISWVAIMGMSFSMLIGKTFGYEFHPLVLSGGCALLSSALYTFAFGYKPRQVGYPRASTEYRLLMNNRPMNAKDSYERHPSFPENGDYEGAIADLEQVIKIQPNDANAFYYRGVAHKNKGELQESIKDFKRVLELSNDATVRKLAEDQLAQLEGIRETESGF
jgi:tetratricopeptide (TPR) repeat protein